MDEITNTTESIASLIASLQRKIREQAIAKDAALRLANMHLDRYNIVVAERDALLDELAEARATIELCAQNTAAADLAQEVEFLKAEIAAMKGAKS